MTTKRHKIHKTNPCFVIFESFLVLFVFNCVISSVSAAGGTQQRGIATVNLSDLPKEAQQTIALIKKGGPYPYKKDGSIFGNFERHLPLHERGYYKEFTVPSPSARNRGARRIILGKAGELYYTDDHYASFRRIRE